MHEWERERPSQSEWESWGGSPRPHWDWSPSSSPDRWSEADEWDANAAWQDWRDAR